jgi:hypothetical protein
MKIEDPKLGKEVQEFMRVCERLIGFARQNNGSLSSEECEAILYYARDLQTEVIPYCKAHHDPSAKCPLCAA